MKNIIAYIFFFTFINISFAQENKTTIKGINRVGLSVNDLEKSVAFYENVMQMKEISHAEMDKNQKAVMIRKKAILQAHNCFFELIQFEGLNENSMSLMPIQGPGITHVCFQSPGTNTLYNKAKLFDAKIVSRGTTPIDRGYGITYAYAKDLNGIMFEMEHLDKPPFKEDIWVGHVAFVTPDIDRLVKYYTQLLGYEPHTRKDGIKGSSKLDDIANIDNLELRAAWFKTGSIGLEMWQFENPKTNEVKDSLSLNAIGYNKVIFEVENLAAEYKRLKDVGIKFLSKPKSNKENSIVYTRDPDGNLIGLEQQKSGSIFSLDKLK